MSFNDLLVLVSDNMFHERPADVRDFVTSKDYMGLPALSEQQYQVVERMSQIYNEPELQHLYGPEEGIRRWNSMVSEVCLFCGKGGGKNLTSTISFAYVVHKLLCLRDPQAYYGKPHGDSIDLLNIAINADQAKNVFFNPFKDRIMRAPWFEQRFDAGRAGELIFDNNIRCFSGHSEREGWEGYNLMLCALDEISGFALETTSGQRQSKTANDIYRMYKASVSSRFPVHGKLALLSFSRFKGDFISSRYDKLVAERHTLVKEHSFTVHANTDIKHTVQWEEDRIIAYTEPRVFALRAPSWIFNPTMKLEHLEQIIIADPQDFQTRFACNPPESIDAFIKDEAPVRKSFPERATPFRPGTWSLREEFLPQPESEYYMHVDLAYKHDRAAASMAHVSRFVDSRYAGMREPQPFVEVDVVRYWTPTPGNEIELVEIKEFILMLRERGFPLKLVTFDQWSSAPMRQELSDMGIETAKLSVNKHHYTDFKVAMYEGRVLGYNDDLLIDELIGLRIIKGDKVDHPRKGSNDIADSVAGAVYNAMTNTNHIRIQPVEIRDLTTVTREQRVVAAAPVRATEPPPQELAEWFERMGVI